MATSAISDDTFEADVLKSATPVVVDFWAEWCGPCRQIAPALEEIAKELHGKVKIVKLNIDENHRTPSRYNVRAIPTLMIFKDGQLAATQTGALPKNRLADWINGNIGVAPAQRPYSFSTWPARQSEPQNRTRPRRPRTALDCISACAIPAVGVTSKRSLAAISASASAEKALVSSGIGTV